MKRFFDGLIVKITWIFNWTGYDADKVKGETWRLGSERTRGKYIEEKARGKLSRKENRGN